MSKPTLLFRGPVKTLSGYGSHSRDLLKSLFDMDLFDIYIDSSNWGSTPMTALEPENNLFHLWIEENVISQSISQPDIYVQVTVPNEFQKVGKYNIGVTAGIETTLVHGSWVEGMNRMDVNFVSSEHSKKSFLNSTFEKRDAQNNLLGTTKLEKTIEVLFEGIDLDVYKPTNEIFDLSEVKEQFAYLFVGHWMQGDMGEDRKNVGLLVKAFYETFKNKSNKPALILKSSSSGASHMDRDSILKRLTAIRNSVNSKNLPNIYLLHGEFTNEEMNQIYNHPKVKSMISLTKGEGFGRPLLEFTASKKPLIVSGWSGHMDFIKPDSAIIIGGSLTNVHPSAVVKDMILAESQWFSPNHGEIGHALRDVFENYKKYKDLGKKQAYHSTTNFSWDKMKELLDSRLTELIPSFPKQVELKLPKLNLPKLEKNG